MTLVRVVAPHFVAGLVVESQSSDSVCTYAAPILRRCVGRSNAVLRAYFERKRWQAHIVPTENRDGR